MISGDVRCYYKRREGFRNVGYDDNIVNQDTSDGGVTNYR